MKNGQQEENATQVENGQQKNGKGKKWKWILAIVILAAAIAGMGAIYQYNRNKAAAKAAGGSKSYTVEVTGQAGETKTYQAATDAQYVGEALQELAASQNFQIQGTQGSYGLYIDSVNGETADYSKDGAYWAFYVNGEYASYSVDAQPIQDKDVIALKYEKQ